MDEAAKPVYPGSFDPVTMGHLDLVERAVAVFGGVIVAVADNPRKKTLFTLRERMRMLRESTRRWPGVEVDHFSGALVEYLHRRQATTVIRGLRAVSDFDYEFQMALTNRKLAPGVETVFLMPREDFFYLSSGLVKELACLGADFSGFVPGPVVRPLKRKTGRD